MAYSVTRRNQMSGSRIIESMKEAVAISRGELSKDVYSVHIPERVRCS